MPTIADLPTELFEHIVDHICCDDLASALAFLQVGCGARACARVVSAFTWHLFTLPRSIDLRGLQASMSVYNT